MTCRLNISVKESCTDLMRGEGGPDPLAKFKFLKLHYNIAKKYASDPPPPLPHANSITFVTQHPSPGQIFLDPRMGINKINHG